MRLPSSNHHRRWRSRQRKLPPTEVVQRRFVLLKVLIVLLFGALLIQLVRMQVVEHASYNARAAGNSLRAVPVLPVRGLIYDRNGEQLVTNKPIFSAAVIPADLPKGRSLQVIANLSTITGVPVQEIGADIAKAKASSDPYTPVIVKTNIDDATAFRLREQQSDLPGVQVAIESVRQYPDGPLVSQVLGFVGRIDPSEYQALRDQGYQLNDRLGKAGVEYTYESVLRGAPGYRQVEVDATGREVKTVNTVAPRPAGNLDLSIDLDLQKHVAQYLQAAMGSSKNASAIVMDVHTGQILSLVSIPSYDDNVFSQPLDDQQLQALLNDPSKPMVNYAIGEVHPPGSTFKMITGTAALQEGVANTNTTITSNGFITVQDEYNPGKVWVMKDWSVLGTMNFYRGVAMSSDVYFYYLSGGYYQNGQEVFHGLGADRLARYARDYGLGAPTGVDLTGEAGGVVPDPGWKEKTVGEVWTLGDTYNFGIGQGYLALTPMQLVRVTAAVANGGDLLVPHVARQVVDGNGKVLQTIAPNVARKLSVSPDNLAIMREAMRQGASYGPANSGASQYVTVAGKTGTAEFGTPRADGTYSSTHAWYTGFAPFDNPQIAVVVFLDRGIGGTNAGPVARQIFDYYFSRQHLAQASKP